MRNFTPLLVFCSLLFVLVSCGKEGSVDTINVTPGGTTGNGNGGDGSEVGNWKFISSKAVTSQTLEMTVAGDVIKTVTTRDYFTENNTGNVSFNGTTMITTNVGYSVSTLAKVSYYTNGVLDASQNLPFTGTIPPTSASANYKKIGTDSIYFSAGVMTGLSSNGSVETRPAGYKLKFEGDKLYMTLTLDETTTQSAGGLTQKVITKATNITTLQKQ